MGRKSREEWCTSPAVGKVLRKARQKAGISMRLAAHAVGIRWFASVRFHEVGHSAITVDQLVKYARVYGVDPVEVLREALAAQAEEGSGGAKPT